MMRVALLSLLVSETEMAARNAMMTYEDTEGLHECTIRTEDRDTITWAFQDAHQIQKWPSMFTSPVGYRTTRAHWLLLNKSHHLTHTRSDRP